MSVTLSSADLDRLGRAVELLVSPLDHGGLDGWRSVVLGELRPLLGADSAGFLLVTPDAVPFYSDEQDELNKYPDAPPPPLADGVPALVRSAQIGVATMPMIYGDDLPLYLGSEHYNDHAAPHHAHDTLAATVPTSGDGFGLSSLHFWHSRPTGPTFGDREVALLRVLRPAFQAGVRTALRWARQRDSLVDTVGAIGQAAAVSDLDGRLLHMTPALDDLMASDPDAEALRASVDAALDAVVSAAQGDGVGAAFERSVATRTAAYTLRGCLYGGHVGAPLAIVSVEAVAVEVPPAAVLRERFGLTPRQADVARLLARRLSNAEIADALSVSPHTARHHVEAVLRKLGLHSRAAVREVLIGG